MIACQAERSRASNIMKQYFVYILKCSDDSYYTGVTSDLEVDY
jgi:predicted GIY-YIG superfamily endonuclease